MILQTKLLLKLENPRFDSLMRQLRLIVFISCKTHKLTISNGFRLTKLITIRRLIDLLHEGQIRGLKLLETHAKIDHAGSLIANGFATKFRNFFF